MMKALKDTCIAKIVHRVDCETLTFLSLSIL